MNKKISPLTHPSPSIQVTVRAIGNSRGVVIPKPFLEQIGIQAEVDMSVEGEKIILSKPKHFLRKNWANDASAIAHIDEDHLVLGDFNNEQDEDWVW